MVRVRLTYCLLLLLCFVYQGVTAQTDSTVTSALISAQEAFNNQDFTKVRERCSAIIEKDSTVDAAYFLLTRVALQEGKVAEAERFISKAVALDTTNKVYNSLAVTVYSGMGSLRKLKGVLRREAAQNPNDSEAQTKYLSLLYTIEDWVELEAATVKCNDLDITQLHGLSQYNLEKYDEALATFLSLAPQAKIERDTSLLLDIYAIAGDIYHLKKDNATSFKYYKKALKLNRRYAPVLNNYAWYIATEGNRKDWYKALAMSRITIDDNPDNSTYLDTYGYLQYLLGDYIGARKTFLHAYGYGGGENVVTLDHYADVLYALKEYDLAFIYYDKALQQAKKEQNTSKIKELEQKILGRKRELKK